MVIIRLSKHDFKKIIRHLNKKTEQVAFLFFSRTNDGEQAIFNVVDYYLVPRCELIHESPYHAEVSEEAQAKVIKMAWDRKLALGEIHSHTGSSEGTTFSPSDLHGFDDFVPHVWWRLKGRPYLALVFGRSDFDALAWISNPGDPVGIGLVVVGNEEYRPTGITIRELQERRERERARYSRQSALFGEEGQRKIAETGVAIVGLGGLGSHIAQQLAYLGVKRYILVDPDVVSRSNLNRLIGATEADIGQKKVAVLSRLIQCIQPDARIESVEQSLLSRKAFAALRRADFVFGCVDNDGVRFVLLDFCCACRKPYLDLASDVPDESTFGGRIVFTGLGKGCLSCREELDQEEIRRFFATPEQREEDEHIYGIDRAALADTGPSVISINGTVASVAVNEFMAYVTGLREAFPHLEYRGRMGTVNRIVDSPQADCYYCDAIWQGREQVNLERYLSSEAVSAFKSRTKTK